MLEVKFGKRKVVNYRGAKTVLGGLSTKNKIDILMYAGKAISTVNDPDVLFRTVIGLCAEIFESDNVTVRVMEENLLKPVAFLRQTEPERRPLESGEGFSGLIYKEQKSQLLEDLSYHPGYLDPGEETRCVICVPISVREDHLGTLSVEKNISHFYKKDDLEILEAMASQIGLALLNARLFMEMRSAQKAQDRLNKQLQFDLKIGRTVQSQIIPETMTSYRALDIRYLYEPMVEVSGDYFDVFRTKNNLTVLLADVSGHGVPAALITMALHYHFRLLAGQGLSLLELLQNLSSQMKSILPSGIYFTAQLLRIHNDYSFSFVNAGHPKMLHFSAHKNELLHEYDTEGLPIGIGNFSIDDYGEASGKIRPGETLVLLTDGFHEQHNSAHQQAGSELVQKWFSEALENIATSKETLTKKYNDFKQDLANEDDLTFITLHYNLEHLGAESLVHQARGKLRLSDYQAAQLLVDQALKLRPNNREALILSGKLALLARDYKTAAELLSRVVELDEDAEIKILLLAGHANLKSGNISSAKRYLKLILATEPNHVRAALLLTRCYVQSREIEKALRTLNSALKYSPHETKLLQSFEYINRLRGSEPVKMAKSQRGAA